MSILIIWHKTWPGRLTHRHMVLQFSGSTSEFVSWNSKKDLKNERLAQERSHCACSLRSAKQSWSYSRVKFTTEPQITLCCRSNQWGHGWALVSRTKQTLWTSHQEEPWSYGILPLLDCSETHFKMHLIAFAGARLRRGRERVAITLLLGSYTTSRKSFPTRLLFVPMGIEWLTRSAAWRLSQHFASWLLWWIMQSLS